MSDSFPGDTVSGPARNYAAVTPADTNLAHTPKAFYVGGAGTLVLTPVDGGAAVTFTVPAGSVLPVRARRVAAASTATGIVALY